MAVLKDEQSGFIFPMIAKSNNGPLKYIQRDTVALIKSSIIQIVLTLPGERMMNPEFGCRLRLLEFETWSPTTENTIINVILEALQRWEPRIEVTSNDITVSKSQDPQIKLSILIHFRVKNPDFTTAQDTTVEIRL